MSSLIGKTEGLYNPALKFAFTNITEEDFTSHWNGQPITVKPGQTISLPHHLADKMTDELVNNIMITAVKVAETTYYQNNPNTAPNFYRAPSSLGVPAARKVWEEKIVRRLDVDEESPEIQLIRMQIKEELERDLSAEVSREAPPVPTVAEFAEIKNPMETPPTPTLATKKTKPREATNADTK